MTGYILQLQKTILYPENRFIIYRGNRIIRISIFEQIGFFEKIYKSIIFKIEQNRTER